MRRILKHLLLMILCISMLGSLSCAKVENERSVSSDSSSSTEPSVKEIINSNEEAEETYSSSVVTELPSFSDTSETPPTESKIRSNKVDPGIRVDFIDVGQGDASLIVCNGEAMMIDGGSSDKSDLIYSYLEAHGVYDLKYVVATHPDDDHIGGLSGAIHEASVERAFCSVNEYDSRPFENYRKSLNEQGVTIEVPNAGDTLDLGGAKVTFIAPIETYEENNNNSIVIRIVYDEVSFLFTGDAEILEEKSILESGQDIKSNVIKIGHHGSSYSSTKDFLNAVSPSLAVISCAEGNDFGFPKQSVLDRLKKMEVKLFRTDLNGRISIYSADGKTLTIYRDKELGDPFLAPAVPQSDPSVVYNCDYILNNSSRKFHLPECESVEKMNPKNRLEYNGDRDELIEAGYEPCQICNP